MPRSPSVPALLCGLFATVLLGAPGRAADDDLARAAGLGKEADGLLTAGNRAEALTAAEQALALAREAVGADDRRLLPVLDRLAGLVHDLGDYTRAEQLYRQAKSLGIKGRSKMNKGQLKAARARKGH